MRKKSLLLIIALICIGALAPSGDIGISRIEILGMLVSLTSILLFLYSTPSNKTMHWSVTFLGVALLWTLTRLYFDPPLYWLRNISGYFFFFGCVLVGSRIPRQHHRMVVRFLIFFCVFGICRDILAELLGWRIRISDKVVQTEYGGLQWELGKKARILATSPYPGLLAALVAPYLYQRKFVSRSSSVFVIAVCIWSSTIMGTGRGETIRLFSSIFLAAAKTTHRILLAATVLILILCIMLGSMSQISNDKYFGKIWSRFEKTDLKNENRLLQYSYAINYLKNADSRSFFFGTSIQNLQEQYSHAGLSNYMHNAFLQTALRYGVPCAVFLIIFWAYLLTLAFRKYARMPSQPMWIRSLIVVTFQQAGVLMLGLYYDWRGAILPGIAIGLFIISSKSSQKPEIQS